MTDKQPICSNCGKPIDKSKGWHMSEGIDPETGEMTTGTYHWDCLGDYGKRVEEVLEGNEA